MNKLFLYLKVSKRPFYPNVSLYSHLLCCSGTLLNASGIHDNQVFRLMQEYFSAPFPVEFRSPFPNFANKIFKKKKNFEDRDFHSINTHTSYMVTFSFNLMAIVCVIANLFLYTKNDIIVHYNKFPNLGVCRASFPNL